jgi:hypothetical protein
MNYDLKILMDNRDVTGWVREANIELMEDGFRSFELTFSAWHHFDSTSTFDIFETLNPGTDAYESILIRKGQMPPDYDPVVMVDKAAPPYLKLSGKEQVWFARRKRPRETIVLVPRSADVQRSVEIALADYAHKHPGRPVGQTRVWPNVNTIGQAVVRLMRAAGVNCSYRLPDHPLTPYVLDPTISYWTAANKLADPWAPVRYYQRWTNTWVFQDATQPLMGDGPPLNIPDDEMEKIIAVPRLRAMPSRILMRFPPWR